MEFETSYIIKKLPEDFLVKEISIIETDSDGGKSGGKPGRKYCYVLLQKKQRNTLDVVKEIARQLRIKEKQIGFAGNKDKQALTEQVISIPSAFSKKIGMLQLDNVTLKVCGHGSTPISLGDLQGNAFEIVVRNLPNNFTKEALLTSLSASLSLFSSPETFFSENYFDEQRFSTHNVAIGRALLKKNFLEAVMLIGKEACLEHLKNHPADFVGALKKIPIRLLRMYVNAFQSALWNKTAAEYLRRKGKIGEVISSSQGELVFAKNTEEFKEVQIPLAGFEELATSDLEMNEIVKQLLEEEKLTSVDFIIKQIPELTAEGGLRLLIVKLDQIKISIAEEDELFPGRKKIKVCFTLPKGSYATMVIKKWFGLL